VALRFFKFHALGNDYLVLEPGPHAITPTLVRRVCDRRRGLGADGVLLEAPGHGADVGLRVMNPDGGEAETSGNGLRVFARYLHDAGWVGEEPFRVRTRAGVVQCAVLGGGERVRVDMGVASFDARRVPVAGHRGDVVDEPLGPGYPEDWRFTAVSVGNPHAVVHVDAPSASLARRWGPEIERDPRFPQRTNVQFVRVASPDRLEVVVWERGAGLTESSGSSACAAAAASRRLRRCDADVVVAMRGGELRVRVDDTFAVRQEGPVVAVAEGALAPGLLLDP
jgi:diaminopimelate epimerase